MTSISTQKLFANSPATDKAAKAFLLLALSYLLFGLLIGVIGGFQYILPPFLKKELSFQQTRPLHVYLVITWIFTAAQAGIYYFLPRISNRPVYWQGGVWLHFFMQLIISLVNRLAGLKFLVENNIYQPVRQ